MRPLCHTLAVLSLAAAAPMAASAQTPPPGPPASLDAVIAALSSDWNGDGTIDAVLLTRGEDGGADLHVYRGGPDGLERVLTVPEAAHDGRFAGDPPQLLPRAPDGFILTTAQTGWGPTPWSARLEIDYIAGDLQVVGYAEEFFDRLDPDHWGACQADLVTGAADLTLGPSPGGARDDASFSGQSGRRVSIRFDPDPFPLTDLRIRDYPMVCAWN